MNKLPQIGEWWTVRIEGEAHLCQVVDIKPMGHLSLERYLIVRKDAVPGYWKTSWRAEYDFDKHHPDCTSHDWKPREWREAVAADIAEGTQPCRFRCYDKDPWVEGTLIGYQHGAIYSYTVDVPGIGTRSFPYCQVYDEKE